MTAREWAPGDVAMVTLGDGSKEFRGTRYSNGWARADDPDTFYTDTFHDELTARRLVVLDPNNREQARRLLVTLLNQTDPLHPDGSGIQAALREFAKPVPVKPDEPTGLGAVVEDREGRRYVHAPDSPSDGSPWACRDEPFGGFFKWTAIDAVKILSEGVHP